jgi:hypothetical protein
MIIIKYLFLLVCQVENRFFLIKILFDPSYLLYIELQSCVSSNRDQKITKSKHGPLAEIALYDKNVDTNVACVSVLFIVDRSFRFSLTLFKA